MAIRAKTVGNKSWLVIVIFCQFWNLGLSQDRWHLYSWARGTKKKPWIVGGPGSDTTILEQLPTNLITCSVKLLWIRAIAQPRWDPFGTRSRSANTCTLKIKQWIGNAWFFVLFIYFIYLLWNSDYIYYPYNKS